MFVFHPLSFRLSIVSLGMMAVNFALDATASQPVLPPPETCFIVQERVAIRR